MIVSLPDHVLTARLLPLVDHPNADVVVAAVLAAESAGAPCVEIGLRHATSMEALKHCANAVSIPVGAGTIVDPEQVRHALDAGASFLVSPGATPQLVDTIEATGAPWLPGASTVSEVLTLRSAGASLVKVFPAALLGGPSHVRAVSALGIDVRMIPTGGVTAENAAEYLEVPHVVGVGGTWMFPLSAGRGTDWDRVTTQVRDALLVTRPR